MIEYLNSGTGLPIKGKKRKIKIPIEIYEELCEGKDELVEWIGQQEIKEVLMFKEDSDSELINKVIYEGYTPEPTDEDLQKIGRDPFLLAYALKDPENRTVVTTEISKPGKVGANRKIPDVCKFFNIQCINTFQMIHVLDFKTSWNSNI